MHTINMKVEIGAPGKVGLVMVHASVNGESHDAIREASSKLSEILSPVFLTQATGRALTSDQPTETLAAAGAILERVRVDLPGVRSVQVWVGVGGRFMGITYTTEEFAVDLDSFRE